MINLIIMKLKTFFYGLSLFLVLLLSSCGTSHKFNKVYPLSSYAILKDGYWGKWEKVYWDQYNYSDKYYYLVQTHYNTQKLEIIIYWKNSHPSDYTAKIIIDKNTGKVHDSDWYSYQGTISSRHIPVFRYVGNYGEYKHNSDDYKTLKCEIRCDKTMQKAILNNGLVGTINVFYGGGLGNAFSFQF